MSRARDVVEVVARALVEHPEDVGVVETERRDRTRVELTTASGDLGKLIGRQGRTANAVRALAEAAAQLDGLHAHVDFVDDAE
ncbi:MAG: KH domain-containing protein [Acidobacteria bacterium]|nr:KH domain-containing protein [Acidobacteriota bacterium]MCY4601222.1 KH domain-containing protein [Acidobacteriota bacterium]